MELPTGARRSNEHQLSMNVLQMKFMQRSRKRLARERSEAKQRELKKKFIPDQNDVDKSASQQHEVLVEHRWDVLEDLVFGRQSFLGFNPQVEKFFAYHEAVRTGTEYESEPEASAAGDGHQGSDGEVDGTGNYEQPGGQPPLEADRTRQLAKAKWSNATFADGPNKRKRPGKPGRGGMGGQRSQSEHARGGGRGGRGGDKRAKRLI